MSHVYYYKIALTMLSDYDNFIRLRIRNINKTFNFTSITKHIKNEDQLYDIIHILVNDLRFYKKLSREMINKIFSDISNKDKLKRITQRLVENKSNILLYHDSIDMSECNPELLYDNYMSYINYISNDNNIDENETDKNKYIRIINKEYCKALSKCISSYSKNKDINDISPDVFYKCFIILEDVTKLISTLISMKYEKYMDVIDEVYEICNIMQIAEHIINNTDMNNEKFIELICTKNYDIDITLLFNDKITCYNTLNFILTLDDEIKYRMFNDNFRSLMTEYVTTLYDFFRDNHESINLNSKNKEYMIKYIIKNKPYDILRYNMFDNSDYLHTIINNSGKTHTVPKIIHNILKISDNTLLTEYFETYHDYEEFNSTNPVLINCVKFIIENIGCKSDILNYAYQNDFLTYDVISVFIDSLTEDSMTEFVIDIEAYDTYIKEQFDQEDDIDELINIFSNYKHTIKLTQLMIQSNGIDNVIEYYANNNDFIYIEVFVHSNIIDYDILMFHTCPDSLLHQYHLYDLYYDNIIDKEIIKKYYYKNRAVISTRIKSALILDKDFEDIINNIIIKNDECVCCLEDNNTVELTTFIDCNHECVCTNCLYSIKYTCPLCRTSLTNILIPQENGEKIIVKHDDGNTKNIIVNNRNNRNDINNTIYEYEYSDSE